jgi:hypothetical protein
MAQQLGMINIRGSVGDITYVRTEDGYHVRRKSSLDKARVLTDKKFAGSRRASSEFATAANAGKLLRVSILGTLKKAGDSKVHSRMLKLMFDILKTDTVGNLGERIPERGRLEMLEGFEFNRKQELVHTLPVQYKPGIDRAAGKALIEFPAFEPREDLLVPEGAAYFKLLSAVAVLDFNTKKSSVTAAESEFFSVNADEVGSFSMSQDFSPATTSPVILVLGIRFYGFVNGNYYQLHADDFNAVRIVSVDQA